MKLAARINIVALSAVLLTGPVAATISSLTASPAFAATTATACCSGGGHSGSFSARSSSSGSHGSSSNGRGTSSSRRGGTSGGYARVPLNTGSLVTRGRMTAVSARAVTLPRSARAAGSSYTVPGTNTVYTYRQPGYWQSVISPRYGTPAYFVLLNDPFYYQNYQIPGSPWYGHPYPLGYTVSSGYFVPVSSPTPWTVIVIGIVAFVAALAIAFVAARAIMNRKRNPSALPSAFGAQW